MSELRWKRTGFWHAKMEPGDKLKDKELEWRGTTVLQQMKDGEWADVPEVYVPPKLSVVGDDDEG